VRDAEAPVAVLTYEPPIAQQGTEDHLELDRVGRDASEGTAWMLDHADQNGRALPAQKTKRPQRSRVEVV
jgi:hypothetical protein